MRLRHHGFYNVHGLHQVLILILGQRQDEAQQLRARGSFRFLRFRLWLQAGELQVEVCQVDGRDGLNLPAQNLRVEAGV